jgi:cytoskeleton protein RodZ
MAKQDAEGLAHSLNLDKVGQILKEKREEQNLSIEYVAERLCLQKTLIKSIEFGNWNHLPHKVYLKGYIKIYAVLLGVYDEILPLLIENKLEKDAEKSRNKNDQKEKRKPTFFTVPHKVPKTIFVYAGIVLLILGFFVFNKMQKDTSETSKLKNAVQVANNLSDSDEKKNIPNIIDTKKLVITCTERTWISVIIDGTEKKEFILKPNEVVMLNAKEKFDLLVGNAGGVKLLFNGKDTDFTGESGEVKRVTFS